MPNLKDLLFGKNGEIGIANPVIKEFLLTNLGDSLTIINKKITPQEAVFIRVSIKEFNDAFSDFNKTKNEYQAVLKDFIKTYIGAKAAETLLTNFVDSVYIKLKKFALLTKIHNHKLRALFIDVALKAAAHQLVQAEKTFIKFEPNLKQIDMLNQAVSQLTFPASAETITAAIQQAFGNNLQLVTISNVNSNDPKTIIQSLNLESLLNNTYSEKHNDTDSVITIDSIINSILFFKQFDHPVLEPAFQKHAAANPLFATGLNSTAIKGLAEQLILVPYDENIEKYAKAVDKTLQHALNGIFAQDKFQGQGIPIAYFSENGLATNFKRDLHRLAPFNLILEPMLKNILLTYAFKQPGLNVTLDEVKKFNEHLSMSYFGGHNFAAVQQLNEIIRVVFSSFINFDLASVINNEQLQIIQSNHERVKILYTIPDSFLKTQLLFFAFSHQGGNFTPTEVEVNSLMALIKHKIVEKNKQIPTLLANILSNHLSNYDLEKIAKLIWPEINFQYSGILSAEYYLKSTQTQILYAIARPQIRAALFRYSYVAKNNKSYSFNQVETLNNLVTKHAVLEFSEFECFISLLKQSGMISQKNVDDDRDVLAELTLGVLMEAGRLRHLYGIYFAPLRNLLIQYALIDTKFSCTRLQVMQLNNLVLTDAFFKNFEKHYLHIINSFEQILAYENSSPNKDELSYGQLKSSCAYDLIVRCFAVSLQEIWDDNVAADFVKTAKLLKVTNLETSDFLNFSVTSFSKNLVATQWFNEYMTGTKNLQDWFFDRFSLRDICINNLINHLQNKEVFEKNISFELSAKNFGDLNAYCQIFQKNLLGLKSNLIIGPGNYENYISQSALRDFLGLTIYIQHQYYLLEFKQPLVKQVLISFWGKNIHATFSNNELANYLEPILTMNDSDSIVEHLTKIFISNTDYDQQFKQALLSDTTEGGGGLSKYKEILRLKGQIRFHQLKALGLKHYANLVLNSTAQPELQSDADIDQPYIQKSLLEDLGSMSQVSWVNFLLQLFNNVDSLIIKDNIELTRKLQDEREKFISRVKPLIEVKHTALSLALFAFAFSSVGRRILFAEGEVAKLNDLVANKLPSLNSPEKFDDLIHKVWPFTNSTNFFCKDGIIADYAESVLKEAKYLYNLAFIQIPGVRAFLAKVAITLRDFDSWTLSKINKLNESLLQIKDLESIEFQLFPIFDNIWPDFITKIFNNLDKIRNSFNNAVTSCKESIPAINIFNNLLASLSCTSNLLLLHVNERDKAIASLAKIAANGPRASTVFARKFWFTIHHIINDEQIGDKLNLILDFFEQQLNIDQQMFIKGLDSHNTAIFFDELKVTAHYWILVSCLEDHLMDFPFLYQPKIFSTLIQYGQKNGLFDPYVVISELRQRIHVKMDISSASDLLVELFAPGSEKFENLLYTSRINGGAGINTLENLKVLLGQLRLSEFEVKSFARWLNSLDGVCRFVALRKLGSFDENQWENWQVRVINRLAAANTKNDIDILQIVFHDESLRLVTENSVFDEYMGSAATPLEVVFQEKEENTEIVHLYSMPGLDAELISKITEEAKNINNELRSRFSFRSLSAPMFFNPKYDAVLNDTSATSQSNDNNVQPEVDKSQESLSINKVDEKEKSDNPSEMHFCEAEQRSPSPSI